MSFFVKYYILGSEECFFFHTLSFYRVSTSNRSESLNDRAGQAATQAVEPGQVMVCGRLGSSGRQSKETKRGVKHDRPGNQEIQEQPAEAQGSRGLDGWMERWMDLWTDGPKYR